MTTSKKSMKEKFEMKGKDLPKTVKLTKEQQKKMNAKTLYISCPKEIDELMKKVPKGKLTTMNEIRKALSKKHGTDQTCPMTTGIFANIVAGYADEQASEGKKRITPYWRTLKKDGEINPKFPFGVEGQVQLLMKEGHSVVKKGKRTLVEGYEKKLAKL